MHNGFLHYRTTLLLFTSYNINLFFSIGPNLKILLNALHPVRAMWYNIGLELDIPHTTLNCFKLTYSDQSDLMREVLMYWLDTAVDPAPTWEAVVTALRSPIVDEQYTAGQLELKYCPPVQCMTVEPDSPSKKSDSQTMSVTSTVNDNVCECKIMAATCRREESNKSVKLEESEGM